MKNVGKKYFAQSLVYGKCELYVVIKDYHDLNVFISKNIPKLIQPMIFPVLSHCKFIWTYVYFSIKVPVLIYENCTK